MARTVDVLSNRPTVTRRLVLLTAHNYAYGDGKGSAETLWQHVRTLVRVESVKVVDGVVCEKDARIYVTSLKEKDLTPAQWLLLVRKHWGVECNHHTLDTAFDEDDPPWIEADGRGLMNGLVLRRIAYTLLAPFRSVTQRSEQAREMRWKELLRWVAATLYGATEEPLAGIRPRMSAAVCA